jgi:hypothetical protein
MALIDDHAGPLSKIATSHQGVALRTAAVLDPAIGWISAIDARRRNLASQRLLSHELRGSVDQSFESIFGGPETVTAFALLDLETTHDSYDHATVTRWTTQLGLQRLDRFGLEADSAGQAEARIISVSRETFGTDQASTIANVNDGRSAIATMLVLFSSECATGATPLDGRVVTLQRDDLNFFAAATIESRARRHLGDIVLRMAVRTGYELQGKPLGVPIGHP